MKYAGIMLVTMAACVAMAGCAAARRDSKAQAYQRWHDTRADMLVIKGEQQFKSGDLDGADSSAKEALSLSPSKPAALMLLARVSIEQGKYAQALTVLAEAGKTKAGVAEIPYLQAVVYERRGQHEQALRFYEQARALAPDNPAYVMASAEVLVALGKASEALGLVENKLISMTESAGVYCMAGDLAMTVGRRQTAANYYRQASHISPDRPGIQERLAKAWFFSAEYNRAMLALEHLGQTEQYRQSSWVFTMLGDCALAMDKPRKARIAYSRATELEPKKAAHWSKLATASLACKDLPRTVFSARRALGLDPANVDASISLGYALLAQNKRAEAQAVLARAERNQPGEAMLKCLLGRCYSEAGQAETAQRYYRATLQLDPDNAVARRMIAQGQ